MSSEEYARDSFLGGIAMGKKRKSREALHKGTKARKAASGTESKNGGKRKRSKWQQKPQATAEDDNAPTVGQITSGVQNKAVRSRLYGKMKQEKERLKAEKRRERQMQEARARELGEEPPPRRQPRTIESAREPDETKVEEGEEEVAAEDAEDEFEEHLKEGQGRDVLITTCRRPSGRMFKFLADLFHTIPGCSYYARKSFDLKRIVDFASNRSFSHLLVFHENRRFGKGPQINSLTWTKLPDGPTARFKLSSVRLSSSIKNAGRPTSHPPELILNNFSTRIGHRLSRMLQSLFPQDPTRRGRRVVTFHNQRDFIFFRHHRYVFEERGDQSRRPVMEGGHLSSGSPAPRSSKSGKKSKRKSTSASSTGDPNESIQCRLQELGPRFTMKLMSLQKGTFDPKHGEYEWIRPSDGSAPAASRRKFYL